MQLYRKNENWSNKFIEKIAEKLQLTSSQVYKWIWDRNEQEKRQRQKLGEMQELPNKIWYVTKVTRKRIQKEKVTRFQKMTMTSIN